MNAKQRRIIRRKASAMFPEGCRVMVTLPGCKPLPGVILSKPASVCAAIGPGVNPAPLMNYALVRYANNRNYWRSLRYMQRIED